MHEPNIHPARSDWAPSHSLEPKSAYIRAHPLRTGLRRQNSGKGLERTQLALIGSAEARLQSVVGGSARPHEIHRVVPT